MWNAGLDESQAGIKIARRNTSNLKYADDTTLMAGSKEEIKSLLMKVKEESERATLKLNIKKTKIMASGCITSWYIEGEKVEVVTGFIFWGSTVTIHSDFRAQKEEIGHYIHLFPLYLPWGNGPRGASLVAQQ